MDASTLQVIARDARGGRVRVRGLLGSPALAQWIEARARQTRLPVGISAVRASSGTGVVRFAGAADLLPWLAGCLRAFGADETLRAERIGSPRVAALRAPSPPSARKPVRGAPAAAGVAERRPPVAAVRSASGPAVSTASDADAWHALPLATVLRRLVTDSVGLSRTEAARRLQRDGASCIRDIPGRGDGEMLLDQFKSVPVALLAGSGVAALASRAPPLVGSFPGTSRGGRRGLPRVRGRRQRRAERMPVGVAPRLSDDAARCP
jgi:hypothetical protein